LKGKKMIARLLFLVFVVASTGAQAEIFMCKKPSGETEFSDTPCKSGSSSEVVPDRDHLTQEQQDAAQQKLQQQRKELNDAAAQRSAAQTNQASRENGVAEQTPPPLEDVYEGDGCYDGGRRNTNCAGDPYRTPIPDRTPGSGERPRPRPRPTSR
jgi:hypothetical protein